MENELMEKDLAPLAQGLGEPVSAPLVRAWKLGFRAGRTAGMTEGYATGYEQALQDKEESGE